MVFGIGLYPIHGKKNNQWALSSILWHLHGIGYFLPWTATWSERQSKCHRKCSLVFTVDHDHGTNAIKSALETDIHSMMIIFYHGIGYFLLWTTALKIIESAHWFIRLLAYNALLLNLKKKKKKTTLNLLTNKSQTSTSIGGEKKKSFRQN